MERSPRYLNDAQCAELQQTCETCMKILNPVQHSCRAEFVQYWNCEMSHPRMQRVWPMDVWHTWQSNGRNIFSHFDPNSMQLDSFCGRQIISKLFFPTTISWHGAQGFQELVFFAVTESVLTRKIRWPIICIEETILKDLISSLTCLNLTWYCFFNLINY